MPVKEERAGLFLYPDSEDLAVLNPLNANVVSFLRSPEHVIAVISSIGLVHDHAVLVIGNTLGASHVFLEREISFVLEKEIPGTRMEYRFGQHPVYARHELETFARWEVFLPEPVPPKRVWAKVEMALAIAFEKDG